MALTVIGMRTRKELKQNVEWARTFKPMTPQEAHDLKKRTLVLTRQWVPSLDQLDTNGERKRPQETVQSPVGTHSCSMPVRSGSACSASRAMPSAARKSLSRSNANFGVMLFVGVSRRPWATQLR